MSLGPGIQRFFIFKIRFGTKAGSNQSLVPAIIYPEQHTVEPLLTHTSRWMAQAMGY